MSKGMGLDLWDFGLSPEGRAYLEYFNTGRYYEAHDALEPWWLRVRDREEGAYLKGLIQLAGAFVHIQKGRTGPARALLGRARYHLELYGLRVVPPGSAAILDLIREWEIRLGEAAPGDRFLAEEPGPRLPRLA